jgi:fluoroquinolone resistance protein
MDDKPASRGIRSNTRFQDRRWISAQMDGGECAASTFEACEFVEGSFPESVWRSCRFVDCRFHRCDLSLAAMPESKLARVEFVDCRLIGINWTEAEWPDIELPAPILFRACALNHSTFLGLDLHDLEIVDCMAKDVDFREADLRGADFSGTNLAESLFLHTVLEGANLGTALNYMISPADNQLAGAKFSLPEAIALLYSMDIDIVEGD